MAVGKRVRDAKAQMPLPPDLGVDVPDRAEHALTKKTLVKDWGLKPWELDRLRMTDMHDVSLAEHAETYIEHQQHEQARGDGTGGMRSSRNSESYQEYQDRMEEQFGGIQ